jgi:hypothetical protein
MEPIKPILIEVKELKVIKLNMGKKALDMTFSFLYNNQPTKIAKTFNFSDNSIAFIMGILNDVKKQLNSKIEKEEEMKEKLVNYMNRLIQQIKDLEKYKEHERYMREFNKIDCYKVNFPEIQYDPARRPSQRWA